MNEYSQNWMDYLSQEYNLGSNLNSPSSIRNALSHFYGIDQDLLDDSMFTGIPKDILALLNPKLSSGYRSQQESPLFQDYVTQVGLLNQPWALNTNRNKSILDAYLKAGMSDIAKGVESRTRNYGNILKDWASSQVGTALKQTYL